MLVRSTALTAALMLASGAVSMAPPVSAAKMPSPASAVGGVTSPSSAGSDVPPLSSTGSSVAPPTPAGRAAAPAPVLQGRNQEALQPGIAALRRGDFARAIEIFQQAVELDPDGVEAHFWLGLAHLEAGDPAAAVGALRGAERLAGRFDARITYQLGVALMRSGRFGEASARFEQVEEQDPGNPLPALNLGWIAMQQDRAARALERFEAVIAEHPDNATAHYFAGRVHEGLADFESAAAAYRRAVQWSPNFLEALLALGHLEMIRGDLLQARASIERAVEAHPSAAEAHAKLGELEAREGKLDAAIGELEAALSIDPGHRAARYNLGLAYARAGRADEADEALARFDRSLSNAAATERAARRREAETRAEGLLRRAGTHVGVGEWEQAIGLLEQVTILTPAEIRAWELLVRAYEATGDTARRDHARRQVRLLRRSRS